MQRFLRKDINRMTDSELLSLYLCRDEAAIPASQQQYGALCFALANRILENPEDAEECVADTWLRAWNAIPPEEPQNLCAYFSKIVRNLAFDRYRARHTQSRGGIAALALDELAECLPANGTTADALEQKLLRESLNRFLHTLPERECTLFLLRYFYAMPLREIAKRLSMREGTAKSSLFRTRKRLRSHLESEGFL